MENPVANRPVMEKNILNPMPALNSGPRWRR